MNILWRAFAVAVTLVAGLSWYASHFDGPPSAKTFLDRHGRLIGTIDPAQRGLRIETPLHEIPECLVTRTLEAEDRYFFWHPGINPFALFKATITNIAHGHIVRGGSTITQQLARNLIAEHDGRLPPRTYTAKFREGLLALALEWRHPKTWILERYLNTISYGRRAFGATAAARIYFGKPLTALTDEEISLLVSLPASPTRRGLALPQLGQASDHLGRHLMEMLATREEVAEHSLVNTTLDAELQRRTEEAIRATLATARDEDPKVTAAAVVIEVKSGDVLALTGSADYFDETSQGYVNNAIALRQPGSALKPFTMFAAFAKGFSPDSIVSDEPTAFVAAGAEEESSYAPQNFDRRFHGNMTLRRALANSYNIPAVATLNEIGLSFYHDVLRHFGITTLTKPPPHYGLAITLGSGEVTLLQLTNAYAALARGGAFIPTRLLASDPTATPQPVLANGEHPAFQVASVLSDPKARLSAFGFNESLEVEGYPVAVKTGTSFAHRDTWTVGYTPSFAVGVWVGHADGSPLHTDGPISGATSAAPVWHAIMEATLRGTPPEHFPQVESSPRNIQPISTEAELTRQTAGPHIAVRSPLPHSVYRVHAFLPKQEQQILAEVRIDPTLDPRLRWYVDDTLVATTHEARARIFLQPTPGRHQLRIESDAGMTRVIPYKVMTAETQTAQEAP